MPGGASGRQLRLPAQAHRSTITQQHTILNNFGKDVNQSPLIQQQQQQQQLIKQKSAEATAPELNLDETIRIREVFTELVQEEYITNKFDLRFVLSELGQYPSDEELSFLLSSYENKVSFTNVCKYLRFYKKQFQISLQQRRGQPSNNSAQEDAEDTLRAFVSLGGNEDGTGSVAVEDLRQVCRNFGLTIDIDAMLNAVVDNETQRTLSYTEFCDMWRVKQQQLKKITSTDTLSRGCSLVALLELRSGLRTLGLDSMTQHPAKSMELSSAAMTRSRDEAGDGYQFPTAALSSAAESVMPATDEAHLNELQHFLFPEKFSALAQPSTAPRRRLAPRFSLQPHLHTTTHVENSDRHRGQTAAKDEDGTTGDEDGQTQANTGGYRAPSPMILSLRNSTAYRQRRLRAFSKKAKTTKKQGGRWATSFSVAAQSDDEA